MLCRNCTWCLNVVISSCGGSVCNDVSISSTKSSNMATRANQPVQNDVSADFWRDFWIGYFQRSDGSSNAAAAYKSASLGVMRQPDAAFSAQLRCCGESSSGAKTWPAGQAALRLARRPASQLAFWLITPWATPTRDGSPDDERGVEEISGRTSWSAGRPAACRLAGRTVRSPCVLLSSARVNR